MFYATRLASPQGSLVPLTPQESLVLYRPKPMVGLDHGIGHLASMRPQKIEQLNPNRG